jgi:HEAT repeat protein
MDQNNLMPVLRLIVAKLFLHCLFLSCCALVALSNGFQTAQPGDLDSRVQAEVTRLKSSDVEVRRDAVLRLGAMNRGSSSRAAATALNDSSEIVRATAVRAVLALAPSESVPLILPLLNDKRDFVRREAAFALGQTRSPLAASALLNALRADKIGAVRGAAAVSLGLIADPAAVDGLLSVLSGRGNKKGESDEFVLRSTIRALGSIKSHAAVGPLSAILADAKATGDLRREAATALGRIGGPESINALRSVLADPDPYVSAIAYEALKKTGQAAKPL